MITPLIAMEERLNISYIGVQHSGLIQQYPTSIKTLTIGDPEYEQFDYH